MPRIAHTWDFGNIGEREPEREILLPKFTHSSDFPGTGVSRFLLLVDKTVMLEKDGEIVPLSLHFFDIQILSWPKSSFELPIRCHWIMTLEYCPELSGTRGMNQSCSRASASTEEVRPVK